MRDAWVLASAGVGVVGLGREAVRIGGSVVGVGIIRRWQRIAS